MSEKCLSSSFCRIRYYKSLHQFLASTESNSKFVNVLLLFDKTYVDNTHASLKEDSLSAIVSIMKRCDNKCTSCILLYRTDVKRVLWIFEVRLVEPWRRLKISKSFPHVQTIWLKIIIRSIIISHLARDSHLGNL